MAPTTEGSCHLLGGHVAGSTVPMPGGAARVAILLCTYNGMPHLPEQLESFAAQTLDGWSVWASDDGSSDDTLAVLEQFRHDWTADRLNVLRGPSKGFAANFLSLACRPDIQADYFAFSDQDDIWDADKLERAIGKLKQTPPDVPALYCGRTRLVDEKNNEIGCSKAFSRPPSFGNALVQNIGGGNTMVFNRAARDLLVLAGSDLHVIAHDWWTYMVVTGCGGKVFYDTEPHMRYRQHERNIYGTNKDLKAKVRRVRLLLSGEFSRWLDDNLSALAIIEHRLSDEQVKVFDRLRAARKKSGIARTVGIFSAGVRHQTLAGNLGIAVASLFKLV